MNQQEIMAIHSRYDKAWWKLYNCLRRGDLNSSQYSKVHQRMAFVGAVMYGLAKAAGL